MTQTTAVRVESILESHLHLIPLMVGVDGESADIGGMTEAAQKIAAEIDALKADNAQANQWLVNGVAKIEELEKQRDEARAWKPALDEAVAALTAARAEIEQLRAQHAKHIAESTSEWKSEMAAVRQERDEARRALLLEREAYSKRAAQQAADGAVNLMAEELADLRAEVERLQTAAEAFWAYEVFTATYLREDRDKFAAAAVRARAAKERKP